MHITVPVGIGQVALPEENNSLGAVVSDQWLTLKVRVTGVSGGAVGNWSAYPVHSEPLPPSSG